MKQCEGDNGNYLGKIMISKRFLIHFSVFEKPFDIDAFGH